MYKQFKEDAHTSHTPTHTAGGAPEDVQAVQEGHAHTANTHTHTPQEERLKVYKQFKEGSKRILVATDLVGRGIDIERVNIVINYDMPETDDVSVCSSACIYTVRVRLCVCSQHACERKQRPGGPQCRYSSAWTSMSIAVCLTM